MATFGGPNIQVDDIILYLDSANKKSYTGNQTVWRDLSAFKNQMILNNVTFDSTDSSLILADINSKLNSNIPINSSLNITLLFTVKLKNNLTEIQTFSKKAVTVSGISQSSSKFNIIYKSFTRDSNSITEKTYLNGQELNETIYTDSNFLNFSNLKVQVNTNGKTGNAKIESLLIYNRALTPQEILQNYNALKSRFSL